MLDIDTAIKHCLEVAEKNDGEAEVYDLLAKNHNNLYEKLTASRFHADCAECAADHRQLAEWLTKLKEAENIIRTCKQVFGFLLDSEIENTSTRYEVKTLIKNITEYLSGGSEGGT